ncbi:hypothetical protein [Pseudomonas syringae]|uniref:hypothetical protein n=1 Tax=Pseudomonas syringae TaxID=317 RepID=UPI0008E512AE|nr:hypothetical protein [Pseudomonas syringae]SFO90717.1 hypothetical protein SAMN05444063_1287 [Pseudomonas syringae]
MGAIHFIRAPDYRFDILRLQQANALMRSANRAVAYGDDIELARLGFAAEHREELMRGGGFHERLFRANYQMISCLRRHGGKHVH